MVKKSLILLITFLSANIIGVEKKNEAGEYPDASWIYPSLENETPHAAKIRQKIGRNRCPWISCRDARYMRFCSHAVEEGSFLFIPKNKETFQCAQLLRLIQKLQDENAKEAAKQH